MEPGASVPGWYEVGPLALVLGCFQWNGKARIRVIIAVNYQCAASGLVVAERRLTVARRFNAGCAFAGLKSRRDG